MNTSIKILLLVVSAIILAICGMAYAQEPAAEAAVQDPDATLNLIMTLLPWLVSLVTLIISVIKLRKSGKTWEETFAILVNTLKDEKKMVEGGFSKDAVAKAQEVAKILGAGQEAEKKVQEILTKGKEQDIKIGSINGKPIYLGKALGIGSALAAIVKGFRK